MAVNEEYMLYLASHGPEDPTRAGLVFAAARGALRAGRNAKVALLGDAVLFMNDKIAASTILAGRNRGSIKQLMNQIKRRVTIHC